MHLTFEFLRDVNFDIKTPGPFVCLKNWDYDDAKITTIRMEDAVRHPEAFMDSFRNFANTPDLILPPADQFRFESFTGRRVGHIDENSHYRSGDPEAWRFEAPKSLINLIREDFHEYLERFYPDSFHD